VAAHGTCFVRSAALTQDLPGAKMVFDVVTWHRPFKHGKDRAGRGEVTHALLRAAGVQSG
jgi:acyl dehydratase